MNQERQALLDLRRLYGKFGYTQYKMSKFEEYDLYVRNKSFLVSDSVITFTDTNGKLMALKPDVTLSIVKNSRDVPGYVQKLYYDEHVYRISDKTSAFQEIPQVGLECLGDIDDYCIAEVLTLAAQSLAVFDKDYILDISNLGILSLVLDRIGISEVGRIALIECIAKKDIHDAERICREEGIAPEKAALLSRLEACSGRVDTALSGLYSLFDDAEWKTVVARFDNILALLPCENIRIDFSVINDMNYYNGIVFQGFVPTIPTDVLSGGQYDNLMARMEKKSGAIGFALYLDRLESLVSPRKEFDVDALLLYDENNTPAEILAAVKKLTDEGLCVLAQKSVPERLWYRQLLKLTESGVETIETNA
ncbi:MAG: ATP phosphoribosyltransferase regulatory subunit [Clostridia bacterium]|nr:ATP phosphoribosyltransferase regulatory subunit [Clostridia bacterium]